MRQRIKPIQSLPAFLAAVLLVFASSSHIHYRYCLDGAETLVSIHFESEETHSSDLAGIDDSGDEGLADIESEFSLDSLLSKFSKTPTDSLAIFTLYLPEITEASKALFQLIGRETQPDTPDTLLPPSRAPPAIA